MNDNQNKLPNYEYLLKSTNYDFKEIESYFSKIIKELENELIKEKQIQESNVSKSFEDYDNNLYKYEDLKKDCIKRYLDEYIYLNEQYEKELLKLESEFYTNKTELLDKIEQEKNIINRIKYDLMIKYHKNKKPYTDKIQREVYKNNKEYERYINNVFDAKNNILRNNSEFYLNANKHLIEIDKTIRFLNELNCFNKSLVKTFQDNNFDKNIGDIDIYISYIDEEKKNVSDISLLTNKYSTLENMYSSLKDELSNKYNDISTKYNNYSKSIKNKITSFNKDQESLSAYYSNLMSDSTNTKEKALLGKELKLLTDTITNHKIQSALEYKIENTLLKRQETNLNLFTSTIDNLFSQLSNIYNVELKKNVEIVCSTFDLLKELLLSEKNYLIKFKNDARDSREIMSYFEQKFLSLDLTKKAQVLEEYYNYINKNIQDNQKLDEEAFSVLTNESILKMKLLDLEREFLTVDDQIAISKLKYENEIEILKETENPSILIESLKRDIDLIEKDYQIDIKIKQNELNNSIYILDLRKKIDLLRIDYMISYAKLENIQQVIASKDKNESKIIDLETQISLQKALEIAIIDSISKQKEYNSLIDKYDKEIETLDEETKQSIRYLNNILEIERDSFEQKREKLRKISKDIEKIIYPSIISIKKEAGKKVYAINSAFENANINEKEYSVSINNKIKEIVKEFDRILYKLRKSTNIVDPNSFNNYFYKINTKIYVESLKNSFHKTYKETNELLLPLSSSSSIILDEKPYEKFQKVFDKLLLNYKNDKERIKASKSIIKFINKEISILKSKFYKEITKLLPLSSSEQDNFTHELSNTRKAILVQEVINTTNSIAPHLDEMKEIRKAGDRASKSLEKEISDYKKNYLLSIKNIENEYKNKFDQLNNLKEAAYSKFGYDSLMINNNISSSISEHIEYKEKLIKDSKETSISNIQEAKDKIIELSKEMETINKEFEKTQDDKVKDNLAYRKQMELEAKDNYSQSELIKANDSSRIKELSINKINNKDKYYDGLSLDALKIKEKWEEDKTNLEDQNANSKISDIFNLSSTFDTVKNNSKNAHSSIEVPIREMDKEIENITKTAFDKVDQLTDLISKNANDSYEDIKNSISLFTKTLMKEDNTNE